MGHCMVADVTDEPRSDRQVAGLNCTALHSSQIWMIAPKKVSLRALACVVCNAINSQADLLNYDWQSIHFASLS